MRGVWGGGGGGVWGVFEITVTLYVYIHAMNVS